MDKVYIVTSGEYDDYYIEKVFSDRKSAELYCALLSEDAQVDGRYRVEEYEIYNNKDADKYKIYRGARFYLCTHPTTPRLYYHIVYSKHPVEKEVEVVCHRNVIRGIIPLDDGVYDYDDIYDMVCKEWDKLKGTI